MVAAAMALIQLAAGASLAAGLRPDAPAIPPAAVSAPLEEDLVLFSVLLDGVTLTETLTAYEATDDPLLPLGELSRLLDLDVAVQPSEGIATGTLGEAQQSLTVDLYAGVARSGGADVALAPGDAAATQTDIYLRATVLQQLLPLRIAVRPEFLEIVLTATETLPIQARAERRARIDSVTSRIGAAEPVLRIETPYRMFSPPALDVAFETGHDSRTGLTARRYDVRAAGDILGAGANVYVGSDVEGRVSNARVLLERRWNGRERLTKAAAGDVFTPLMIMGPRSEGGRGFAFTSGPAASASAFQRITLRGELPIGYDVELYVNDVLRSGQRIPVEGRYEFVDVPLSRGVNIVRIVSYGPRGERSETTQVLNVGGGQMERGALAFDFGAVEQDQPVIDLRDVGDAPRPPAEGTLRAAANLAYGLTDTVTLVSGAASFTDTGGKRRDMVTSGLRGSLGGVALLGDVAYDFSGGTAVAAGAAAEFLGISATLRHIEYGGGFIDESDAILDQLHPPSNHNEASLAFDLRPLIGAGVPVSLNVHRDAFEEGGSFLSAFARASAIVDETLVSAGLDYTRDTSPDAVTMERLTGNLAASRYIGFQWRTRATLDYDLIPEAELRAFSVTADRDLTEHFGIGFGAGQLFGPDPDTTLQARAWLRLPVGDVTFGADYGTANNDWRASLRLAFGMVFDRNARRPRLTRPGPATGGSAMVHAFVDRNADGVFDPDEEGVAGVVVTGGEDRAVTGPDGRVFVSGLGDAAEATLRADIGGADLFYVSAPPETISLAPRAGAVATILYPMTPVGEVFARLVLRRGEQERVGLSAVRVRLVGGEAPIEANTEFDGSVLFADVRPGTYELQLDPEQAQRLGMRLAAPVQVVVAEDGYASDVTAEVVFEQDDE